MALRRAERFGVECPPSVIAAGQQRVVVSVPLQMVQNLAQTLASEIADGRRPPGSALPSTRALAAHLGCAPGTVARAYGELRQAGLIAARDRARARVADGGSPRARWWLAGGPRLRLAPAGRSSTHLDVKPFSFFPHNKPRERDMPAPL